MQKWALYLRTALVTNVSSYEPNLIENNRPYLRTCVQVMNPMHRNSGPYLRTCGSSYEQRKLVREAGKERNLNFQLTVGQQRGWLSASSLFPAFTEWIERQSSDCLVLVQCYTDSTVQYSNFFGFLKNFGFFIFDILFLSRETACSG